MALAKEKSHTALATTSQEAILHLREAIASGQHWFTALLDAVALWTAPEETYNGRRFRYLIGGEAFDWLTLAERLCLACDGAIPQQEGDLLLLRGQAPIPLRAYQLRSRIGPSKYTACLNYFYGVVVEEALQTAVEEELYKESYALGYLRGLRCHERMFELVYGDTMDSLRDQFRKEMRLRRRSRWSYLDTREFLYWLFKLRLRQCDRARVASDTKKGLEWLQRVGGSRRPLPGDLTPVSPPFHRPFLWSTLLEGAAPPWHGASIEEKEPAWPPMRMFSSR